MYVDGKVPIGVAIVAIILSIIALLSGFVLPISNIGVNAITESELAETAPPVEIPAQTTMSEAGSIVAVPTRTPAPTATPGVLQDALYDVAERTGLDEVTILGLSAGVWINLIICS